MATAEHVVSFSLESPGERRTVRPLEPLYSMLVEAPPESLMALYRSLLDYHDESALDDRFPEVGLTRRDFLEQAMLALRDRGML